MTRQEDQGESHLFVGVIPTLLVEVVLSIMACQNFSMCH